MVSMRSFIFGALLISSILKPFADTHTGETTKDRDTKSWDVSNPPGESSQQQIESREGTWMNLDISPDGSQIVFDFLGDLYLMPIEGADGREGCFPVKLTSGMSWDMQPQFSPDGTRIAFTSDRTGEGGKGGDNIWVLDLETRDTRQITAEDYRLLNGPAWSPDGQYIVGRKHFTSRRSLGSGEMWLYHAGGVAANAKGGVALTQKPNEQKDVNEPAFSPDGRYLYYSQDTTPGDQFEYDKDSHGQIYVVKRLDLEKGETESLITGPGGACRPVPSPDGKKVAFVRRTNSKTGLHLFDLDSGAIELLYDGLERDMQETWAIHGVYPAFDWTPDNESIVFWAKGRIHRFVVGTGEVEEIPFLIEDKREIRKRLRFPIEVAPENFDVRMLRWVSVSPQGDKVVFQALGHIYIKDKPEGKPRRLTTQNQHFEFYPTFSRDGRYVAYTTWNDTDLGSVRVASVESSGTQENWRVTTQPGHFVEPVMSPDSETIVYRRVGGGHVTSPLWSREQGIYRIGFRGGEEQRVSKQGYHPQFGNDDDRVFYVDRSPDKDNDNTRFISSDLDGHEVRVHFNSRWATDYAISGDGEWMAFIERHHVYISPFVQTGRTIEIGPGSKALPIVRASQEAGNSVHFSGDNQYLYWSLGPHLYESDITELYTFKPKTDVTAEQDKEATPDLKAPKITFVGFSEPYENPKGRMALIHGHVMTMDDREIIRDSVVLVSGNRIQDVGRFGEIVIPEGYRILDVSDQWILPGFIDTHAHGSQGNQGIIPQSNWIDLARLAFGVTTIHDPSNHTETIFAASELAKAGLITAPRTFSTGTILYGATGSYKTEIESLEDAQFHLKRMKAVGAFTVKSYNQPRRDQRQQILEAARELEMMVVPEGGSTFMHNLNMVVDGHTGIEHTLPVETIYDDVLDLWRGTGVGYTPTLSVAYGGLWGENFWYQQNDLWRHPRITTFIPPHVINPRARRRLKAPLEDFNHIRVAGIANKLVQMGELAQAGGHGQLNGLCTHWEMWSFVQGGMSNRDALKCGTLNGASYLGLDKDLGSIQRGKLADLVVMEPGAHPLENIRDTERVGYVMVNGKLFDASTMDQVAPQEKVQRPFYWETGGYTLPPVDHEVHQFHCVGCGARDSNSRLD